MANETGSSETIRVQTLSERAPNRFRIAPDASTLAALASELDLLGLPKVVFEGAVVSDGRRDWRLDGHLGATVEQACVATLEPVVTRIETGVVRRFLADGDPAPEAEEIEMPEDDTIEPLRETISLMSVLTEALSLALPPYPRADSAEHVEAAAMPEGAEPLTDEAVKPFAGLAALRDKLGKDG